ncbi:MAG TPA: tetratricopeptide repeat protein [Terriglobales bacterium]|nr:tetratricopeptide repeat protein [Terriglobales bacterium]
MRRREASLLWILLCSICAISIRASAQVDRIVIAAGTDEDKALQAISAEQDPQKKLAMYEEFVQKFAANPAAVTYGNWQISQAYQAAGDLQKALDYGDKALVGSPHDLDILVSQASLAQQAKNNAKLMEYSAKGGEVCQSIAKQAKPAGMSDADFAAKVNEDKSAAQSSCDFLETSGVNVISGESDPKVRMAYVDEFTAGFPNSKYQETVSNLALDSLNQLKDGTRLVAYGEKILAADPNSLPALLLMAGYYGDDKQPGSGAKAISYAQRAIEVAKADAPDADKAHKLSAGAAYSTIGWVYLKQDRSTAAIPDLKAAAALLKGQDDQQYARALYGLGFAYGKLNKLTEAREVLTEAVKIPGPLQGMSQDLLAKVNSARAKGR